MENISTRERKESVLEWWIYIVAIGTFLVIVTCISTYFNEFPLKKYFDLGRENNFAAWWSGACLLGAALLTYEVHSSKEKNQYKGSLVILSVLLLGLSADEISSFHERVESFSRLLPYGIVAISLLCYSLLNLMKKPGARNSATYIFAGFLWFGFTAANEYLEHSIIWPYWLSGIRLGIEEGSELLGELLILIGIIKLRGVEEKPNGLQDVISNPYNYKSLNLIFLSGLALHTTISLLVSRFDDLDIRGNPAVFYPSFVYFVLFCASYWNFKGSNGVRRKMWLFASVFFVFFSISCVQFPLGQPIPYVRYYLFHIAMFSLIYLGMCSKIKDKHVAYLCVLLGMLTYLYITKDIVVKYIVSGVVAYFIFDVVMTDKGDGTAESIQIQRIFGRL